MDGHRVARGKALQTALGPLYDAMLLFEEARQRKRRASVVAAETAVLEAFVVELYWMARSGGWRWSAYATGNRKGQLDGTRYATPLQYRPHLAKIAAFLHQHGFIEVAKGYRKPDHRTGGIGYEAVSTKARATPKLIAFLEEGDGVSPVDVCDGQFETIRLRGPKCDQWLDDTPGPLMNRAGFARGRWM